VPKLVALVPHEAGALRRVQATIRAGHDFGINHLEARFTERPSGDDRAAVHERAAVRNASSPSARAASRSAPDGKRPVELADRHLVRERPDARGVLVPAAPASRRSGSRRRSTGSDRAPV
jgi:hypothetical protein